MSVAPLEFWAVTVRLNDVPAVSAVGAARTSLSYEAVGRANKRADHQIGHRRAQAGDIVVAGPGRVVRVAGARAAGDVVEVGRVLVQDVHHLLRTRAVERRLGRSRRGPGRRSPGAPTTAVRPRWCRQPRPSRRSSPRMGRSHRRRRRSTAMRHRRRPGWLAPSTSASPHLSGMTVATRRRWGRRRCRSSRPRLTRHCPCRG